MQILAQQVIFRMMNSYSIQLRISRFKSKTRKARPTGKEFIHPKHKLPLVSYLKDMLLATAFEKYEVEER